MDDVKAARGGVGEHPYDAIERARVFAISDKLEDVATDLRSAHAETAALTPPPSATSEETAREILAECGLAPLHVEWDNLVEKIAAALDAAKAAGRAEGIEAAANVAHGPIAVAGSLRIPCAALVGLAFGSCQPSCHSRAATAIRALAAAVAGEEK